MPGNQRPDPVARLDGGARRDARYHWLIRQTLTEPHVDRHDTDPGDRAGEGHQARHRCEDRLAGGARQVHAAVTRAVGRGRTLERRDDLDRGQRCRRRTRHRREGDPPRQ
jgi:hypothetical protein